MKQFGLFWVVVAIVLLTSCSDSNKSSDGDKKNVIRFADPEVKALCVKNWDADSDGELSYDEASTVQSIGNVFTNNVNISSFDELEYLTAIKTIDREAFFGCINLISIKIPSGVTTIGHYAFRDNESLKHIVIPASVTHIDSFAFQNCTSLEYFSIPESVKSLGDNPVVYCSRISKFSGKYASEDAFCLIADGLLISHAPAGPTDYVLPANVTTVGGYSFKCCNNLRSATIHDSVEAIGYQAFTQCANLKTVVIGNKVNSIQANAFEGCENLTAIYCKSIIPPAGGVLMFDNIAPAARIYVPAESVETYRNSAYWSAYADRIEGYSF